MDYQIEEVIRVMKHLEDLVANYRLPKLDSKALEEGLSLSKRVCAQPEFVFTTPLAKNLLVIMGDVKQYEENGEWHTEKLPCGAKSKAVAWINDVVKACLLKFNGPEKTNYSGIQSCVDPQLYNVDCWLGWKPDVWDIQPGQAEQRKETFMKYSDPKTSYSVEQCIDDLRKDIALQKAVLLELQMWPRTMASKDVREISDPFMSKKTGVSYPDYRNDSTLVPKELAHEKGETYGKYEIRLVEEAYNKGGIDGLRRLALENNVYTGYPRNQRGKGRALEAQSRRTNLVVNMINSVEIEEMKHIFAGTAFLDVDGIKENLIQMAELAEAIPGVEPWNRDFTSFDSTVGAGHIALNNAVRYMCAMGQFSKSIVEIRHVCCRKAWFVDGPNNRITKLYGRTPSGYDDTTLMNTNINRIFSNAGAIATKTDYTARVAHQSRQRNILTVGDDLLLLFGKGVQAQWNAYMKRKGFIPHEDDKDAFGIMFIQYRLIKKDGEWRMAYNWPRVLRSMLSKETAKQLGKGGWTLSFYQQLDKLIELPEMCAIPLNICAALDKDHLMLDVPISDIKKMVDEEDQERLKAVPEAKKGRVASTAERLASNPQFAKHFNNYSFDHGGNPEINYDYFGELQGKLRKMYDPQFLEKLGFKTPDVSKVH